MKLKEHIEKFDESLLDEKVNKPSSKDIGMLQEHIARFNESLGETPIIKSTSKKLTIQEKQKVNGITAKGVFFWSG